MQFGDRGARPVSTEESYKSEQTRETVQSQIHKKFPNLVPMIFLEGSITLLGRGGVGKQMVSVPIDFAPFPCGKLFLVPRWIECGREWSRSKRCDQSHNHEDSKRSLAKNLGLKPNVL